MQEKIDVAVTPGSSLGSTVVNRRSMGRVAKWTLSWVLLVGLCALFLAPFVWMVSSSFQRPTQLFHVPPIWIPQPFTLQNYAALFREMPFWVDAWHSLYISLFNVVATTASCAVVAYGFAWIPWRGRNVAFIVLIASLILPYQVVMIPQYLIFKWLGWLNTFNPLTWPALLGTPFFIFLLRQFMLTLPKELRDAAIMDGANEWQIFQRIVLPLVKPALFTVAVFTFAGVWTDFLGPLIYLDSPQTYTLTLGLYLFQGAHSTNWGALMAGVTLMAIPVILFFFFAQRSFIQGLTLTGSPR